jgi:hypothetical protein
MGKKKNKNRHNRYNKPQHSFLKDNSKYKTLTSNSYQIHNAAYEVFGSLFYTSSNLDSSS